MDESTQRSLLREIETQSLFHGSAAREAGSPLHMQVIETVPLSQIGEGRLLSKRRRGKCDASSNASSNFTSVSGGRLDGELVGRFGGL